MQPAIALGLALAATGAARAGTNHAAAFGWQGYATTDLELADFAPRDHTIVLRFFPQYAKAIAGPFITSPSGNYAIGIGAYGPDVHLELVVGRTRGTYSFGDAKTDKQAVPLEHAWHTLAVVCRASTCVVFVDGRRRVTDARSSDGTRRDLAVPVADRAAIAGKLQLGRSSDAAQFYGLLDDVAVFDRALEKAELDQLFAVSRFGAGVAAASPLRAWTFDSRLPDDAALPAELAHPIAFRAGAGLAIVSADRDRVADDKALPLPAHQSTLELPFPPGVVWRVTQAYEGPTGHSGRGAFALDFVRHDAETCGSVVTAPAAGTLVRGCDLGDPPDARHLAKGCATDFRYGPLVDGYNFALVETAPDETAVYLHIQNKSLRRRFTDHAADFRSPKSVPPPDPLSIVVARGDAIARAGTRKPHNCHLHFAMSKNGNGTFPAAFSNYEVLDPRTRTWKPVARGIPRYHEYVRRPKP